MREGDDFRVSMWNNINLTNTNGWVAGNPGVEVASAPLPGAGTIWLRTDASILPRTQNGTFQWSTDGATFSDLGNAVTIVNNQVFFMGWRWGIFNWYWVVHFPMVFLFFISALAETNRPPFDLPEAESELVAGYQVEYSSTPFLLFMIGEYMAAVLMCTLTSLLFLGGWLSPVPFLPDGFFWLVLKMLLCFFVFSMVKAITPRYRYDQLMRLGWKVFLPFSLVWVVLVAFLAKYEVLGGFWARYAVGG